MTVLYHYTTRTQLPKILASGELLMTPNPFTPQSVGLQPVVWLTHQDGVERPGDTLVHGLNLAGAVQGFLMDRIEVRFTVDVPDADVMSWDTYCEAFAVDARTRRQLAKWPCHPDWWHLVRRSIPSTEWLEIGVGRNDWEPMFDPQSEEIPVAPTDQIEGNQP